MKMETLTCDLHIHSALSPCAEPEMNPPKIFRRALDLGLDILAITDHNAVDNLPAFLTDVPSELWVIPGIEIQTLEDAHLILLFGSLEAAMDFGHELKAHMPNLMNVPDYFGEQVVLDRQGVRRGTNKDLLLTAVGLRLSEIIRQAATYDALCYPAHVDRKAFSIQSQLGFIPPELPLPTIEISYAISREEAATKFPGYQWIQASDAHRISEIGRGCSLFKIEEKTWDELKSAFYQRDDRYIEV